MEAMDMACDAHEREDGEDDQEEACKVSPALLCLHPQNKYVVVAAGVELRVFNLQEKIGVTIRDTPHTDAIKVIRFDPSGKLFLSAGDDKLVKLWDVDSWKCIKTMHTNKKVSAASFSHDGEWLLYADKFGVVFAFPAGDANDQIITDCDRPVQLLAHCCSIITSLDCSMDGRFIITSDRDFKIRISIFPDNPLQGAHEIHGFCLAHTSFVSCISTVGEDGEAPLLVSGGGDGTVRLWEIETAELLDTYDTTLQANLLGEKSIQQSVITCLSVTNDGSTVAVGIDSLYGIIFVRCDRKLKKLFFLQKLVLLENVCPTSIQFDKDGRLWMVAGAAQTAEGSSVKANILLRVLSKTEEKDVFRSVEPECPAASSLLFDAVDTDKADAETAILLADAANISMKNELSKKLYSHERRESQKYDRNDRKLQREARVS